MAEATGCTQHTNNSALALFWWHWFRTEGFGYFQWYGKNYITAFIFNDFFRFMLMLCVFIFQRQRLSIYAQCKHIAHNHIMASHAFALTKEVFIMETVVFWHHDNGWLPKKQLFWCKFSYANNHLYSVINFNHIKLRYIEPCNFLAKHILVSQPSTLVVAKDPNISHYLNLSIYLPTIILSIIWYTPNMTAPHKWTKICWLASQKVLVNLLLLINKFRSFVRGNHAGSVKQIMFWKSHYYAFIVIKLINQYLPWIRSLSKKSLKQF